MEARRLREEARKEMKEQLESGDRTVCVTVAEPLSKLSLAVIQKIAIVVNSFRALTKEIYKQILKAPIIFS